MEKKGNAAYLVAEEIDELVRRIDTDVRVRLAEAVDPFLLRDDVEFDPGAPKRVPDGLPCRLLG